MKPRCAWSWVRVAALVATSGALNGCATWTDSSGPSPFAPTPIPQRRAASPEPPRPAIVPAAPPRPAIVPVAYQQPAPPVAPEFVPALPGFDGRTELTPADVVRVVLERNPTLEQMTAAAAAVAARYPQSVSLDDPTFGFSTAPGSIGSPNTDYAARVEIWQKLPYPGKRNLRGSVVRAEAAAAIEDVNEARLQLAESATSAVAEYYLAHKAADVAAENLKLLREFRANAETRYKNGQGPQQDMLQADVEIARQEERLIALRRARLVAIARINMLMHLPPDSPLPPPADITVAGPLPDAAQLRERAVAVRPELRAAAERLAGDEANLALALKEYNPDVEVMAAYDGFWQGANGRPLQWQAGLRMNLPVRYARRAGAVAEARAKVAQRHAELARLTDRVNFEVQEAFEQVREAEEIVRLYEGKVLPAALANVKEARAGYVNAKVPFLNLIEAQRNAALLRDRYYEAVAETARRRATLDRAVGGK